MSDARRLVGEPLFTLRFQSTLRPLACPEPPHCLDGLACVLQPQHYPVSVWWHQSCMPLVIYQLTAYMNSDTFCLCYPHEFDLTVLDNIQLVDCACKGMPTVEIGLGSVSMVRIIKSYILVMQRCRLSRNKTCYRHWAVDEWNWFW